MANQRKGPVLMAKKLFTIKESGGVYTASVDGEPNFQVGRRVKYPSKPKAGEKQLIGITNTGLKSGARYRPEDYRAKFGFWADFIYPTALCEGNGYFRVINTYDRAYFTFAVLQFAAHVADGDFVRFFRRLLARPEASDYFPDLAVVKGRIVQDTQAGPITLETKTGTGPLQTYLNPSLDGVENAEVDNAARFIHWCENYPEHRDLQVECSIEEYQKLMKTNHGRYNLEGVPAEVCLTICDIHHQGRAKVSAVKAALKTHGDYAAALNNLLAIGGANRTSTLRKTIARMKSAQILGTKVYRAATNDFG